MRTYDLLKAQVYSSEGVGQVGACFLVESLSARQDFVRLREFYLKTGREVSGVLLMGYNEFFRRNPKVISTKSQASERVPRGSDLASALQK